MYFQLIIVFSMSFSQIFCINLTESTVYGVATPTTEYLNGLFRCSGSQGLLKKVVRDAEYRTKTPCTGISYLTGNDSYEIVLSDGRKETMDLFGPQTFSAYINGYQLFTQLGPIRTGFCTGGYFTTVQLLYPRLYPGCAFPLGLIRAESFYSYIRIQGGKCESDCFGELTINFVPPVLANYVD